MDTIFSLATVPGRSGVAVIRVSGPKSCELSQYIGGQLPKPRISALRSIQGSDGSVIDKGLIIWFPAPASFTGEDVIELQIHGGIASVRGVLQVLGTIDGFRHSEPGEFTRRALENGKLDLTAVEGLADVIDAETEAQLRQAQRTLSGSLSKLVEGWRGNLIRAASLIEATIDFADEEVPENVSDEVLAILSVLTQEFESEVKGSFVAERIREGFEVAIVGLPNSGKSTLLNALAGRDAAITSSIAGTTRDVIEVRMDLDGLAVTLLDTAGLRDSDDEVEQIGISRAIDRATQADLRVFLMQDGETVPVERMNADIVRRPKADITPDALGISGLTGEGVDKLVAEISSVLSVRAQGSGVATRERHRLAISEASRFVIEASAFVKDGPVSYDLGAESLRTAIRTLEVLVGRIDVENLLDEIFSSFCLGK
ncbi:MAG: tRNA uridine-5-carboxymethylaminomethyl(34) synthesis GTPase MnmE [Paracoccaceae bacterium]